MMHVRDGSVSEFLHECYISEPVAAVPVHFMCHALSRRMSDGKHNPGQPVQASTVTPKRKLYDPDELDLARSVVSEKQASPGG